MKAMTGKPAFKGSINLKPYQDEFIFSRSPYPAMISGWGTGKTMSAIVRGMIYSEKIPDNLGIVFRKEFTDLRDSTIKDFELYTKLKVNSHREVKHANGSVTMFRHIEEINNIQNINLGWFYIEQAEELKTDREFLTLFGRLRRKLSPSAEFQQLGLPERTGFIIGNPGPEWIKRIWKVNQTNDQDFHLVEAKTYDNADILPDDFLNGLEKLRRERPELYARYVENSWDTSENDFILIKPAMLEALRGIDRSANATKKKLIAVDPAFGGDECVIQVFEDYRVIDQQVIFENDSLRIAGHINLKAEAHDINDFIIDTIGWGKGVVDIIKDTNKDRFVIEFNSAEASSEPDRFLNQKAEAWWDAYLKVLNKEVAFPEDEKTRKQLMSVKYVPMGAKKIKIEAKHETKKRLSGDSPDRGDTWVMGVYAHSLVPDWKPRRQRVRQSSGLTRRINANVV